MRVTLARVGPVAMAFDCDVATFGFPFEQARFRKATRTQSLRDPSEIAAFVAQSTTIGEGGEHFTALTEAGRFRAYPFPADALTPAFPPALGNVVATTPYPSPAKRCAPLDTARELAAGHPQLLIFGLGPRGLPQAILDAALRHLEITGRGVSLETATALGALPAMVQAHLEHLAPPASGPVATKASSTRGRVP